ncbi:ABC transporter ATP-binding protein [Bordetella genomosp. 10]|uniref:ABC transporter ATP-binding protein n=1 Tax=Bordetella genomosp. 10 TaxID=1416804 RepID=A0A261S5S3_9BORD|nr:ABC transporter ATP-binding protein [Bordetella genomosp. 10]OZI31783.1 ABC transporter ATP-binding protein [Bordetella genomosp. 10]
MSHVIFEGIGKTFRDARRQTELVTLQDVSLSLGEHELLCLLGPSGCGKSTLLNMLAGFEHPTEGRVLVDGKPVTAPGADRGMVFQQATLMPWLPVWENVAFPYRLRGAGKAERRRQAQPFIDLVGLTGFEEHYPAELSGGMSQRVGIARALLLNPGVILMDEPFAALDAQTKADIQEELVTIWQKSRSTIVFVTHSVEEALILGTQVAVMTHRPGRIRELIPVDLPRPRDTTTPRFNEIKRHVLGLIREEAALARAA